MPKATMSPGTQTSNNARPTYMIPVQYTAIAQRVTAGHFGVDLDAALGTPIYSPADGVVTDATNDGSIGGFGNWVRIKHDNGFGSVHGHIYNGDVLVQVGQRVRTGDQIAKVGSNGQSTGPHDHFEWRMGGVAGIPIDGIAWLESRGAVMPDGSNTSAATGTINAVNTSANPAGLDSLIPGLSEIITLVKFIIDPHNWLRMAEFIAGAALLLMGGTALSEVIKNG